MAQDAPLIGANISGDVDYAVMFGSLTITEVTCNATNHCTARVTGSRLNSNGSLTVSVVASNAVGSGPPATFPTQGVYILHGHEHGCIKSVLTWIRVCMYYLNR